MARLPARAIGPGDEGVSPVIGTVFVLAITVLGIVGVLFWGAPTIDRIQSRNAKVAMEGEFEGLRDASQELSVPDHSRFPTLAVPSGNLGLQQGSRFLVAANHDAAHTGCDLHVTDWSDSGADKDKVTVSASGCRSILISGTPTASQALLEVYSVGGTTTVRQTVVANGGYQVVGADFSKGDWMFRLTDGASGTPVVYAEAWLHSTDDVTWNLKSSTGTWDLYLDGGAIFSRNGGTYFLEKAAPIGDSAFGKNYTGLWLRTLVASGYRSLSGQASHQVYLSLLGNSFRVDNSTVYKVRIDISGTLSQAWCNALVGRNPAITGTWAAYTASAGYTCESGDAQGLRSVVFAPTAANAAFQFRFLHARITTSLSV